VKRALLVLALVASALVVAPSARAHHEPRHITGYIPVAQGTDKATTLHYQVLLPDPAVHGDGPYPTVVDYSGYMPAINIYDGLDDRFLAAGYAVAGVNIRGTGCSGGIFDYFEPVQSTDGAEAIDFLGSQEWSNGKVAMVGKSYPGITQLFVAAQRPEHLTAIVPGHVFGDLYRDVPFPGGIMNVTFSAGWSAGRLLEMYVGPQYALENDDQQCMDNQAMHVANPPFNPFVRATYNHYDGPLFHERSPWYFADRIAVPTFLVESWQDEQVGSRAVHLIERLAPGLPWRMLVTNGDHGEYYGPDVFPHILEFLDIYMGEDTTDEERAAFEAADRVRVNWETGAGGGRTPAWSQTYASWPVPGTSPWRLYLYDDGSMSETPMAPGGGVAYTYAPGIGSQQRGGESLQDEPPASWDDRPADGTSASFTTAPLDTDKVLLGSASLDLWLSSTAADTDLEVTLSEVRPDGSEVFVQQGWLRASHRREVPGLSTELRPYQSHLLTDVEPLVPNQPVEMRVEIFPFGHVFRAGSQVRVTVAAPHVRPDLWGFAALPTPARNTIWLGSNIGSSLVLPLVPGTAATPLPPCTLRNQPCRAEVAP